MSNSGFASGLYSLIVTILYIVAFDWGATDVFPASDLRINKAFTS